MAALPRFGTKLKEAIKIIAVCQNQTLEAVRQELGQSLNPSRTGSAIEDWGQRTMPKATHIEQLAKLIIERSCGRLDRAWLNSFLHNGRFHDPQKLCDELFPAPQEKETQREETPASDLHLPPFLAPARSPTFVGRAPLVKQLRAAIYKRQYPIVGLIGLPGVGKTALATQLAHQLRDHFPDGVLWAQLDASSLEATIMSFATAINATHLIAPLLDVDTKARQLRQLLATKKRLIILDNAQSSQDLNYLIPSGNNSLTIVTTNNQNIYRDHEILPVHIAPFTLQQTEELLLAALGPQRLQKSRGHILRLHQLTGGLPFALSLVAAHLELAEELHLSQYNELLANEKERLEHLSDWHDTQHNVAASFETIYATLPEPTQTLLTTLGLFSGPDFSSQAVAAALKWPLPLVIKELARLRSLSLVNNGLGERLISTPDQAASHKRYRLHPLLKAFTIEKLAPHQSERRWQLATYFANLLHSVGKTNDFSLLDLDWENMMGTIRWAQAHKVQAILRKMILKSAQTFITFTDFMNTRGYYHDATLLLTQLLYVADNEPNSPNKSWIHNKRAFFHLRLDKLTQAQQDAQQAYNLSQESNDLDQQADSLRYQGIILHQLGELNASMHAFENELAIRFQIEDPERLASTLMNLSSLHIATTDYQKATDYISQAVKINEAINNPINSLASWSSRGVISLYLGQYGAALDDFKQALILSREENFTEFIAQNYLNMGMGYLYMDRFEQALEQLEKALPYWHQLEDKSSIALTYTTMAEVYAALGHCQLALAHLAQAQEEMQSHSSSHTRFDVQQENQLTQLFTHLLCSGATSAVDIDQQLKDLAQESLSKYMLTRMKLGLGMAAITINTRESRPQALATLEEALALCKQFHFAGLEPVVYAYLGTAYLLAKNIEDAWHHSQIALNLLTTQKHVHGSNSDIYWFAYEAAQASNLPEHATRYIDQAYQEIQNNLQQLQTEELKIAYLKMPLHQKIYARYK